MSRLLSYLVKVLSYLLSRCFPADLEEFWALTQRDNFNSRGIRCRKSSWISLDGDIGWQTAFMTRRRNSRGLRLTRPLSKLMGDLVVHWNKPQHETDRSPQHQSGDVLSGLTEKHDLSDTVFSVDQFGYRTARSRLGLSGQVGYTDRNFIKKW